MINPKVVNVSFAGDPLEADIDAFALAMPMTTYWGDRTKEYLVAPITTAGRIHDPTVWPATVDNAQIQSWLVAQLEGGGGAGDAGAGDAGAGDAGAGDAGAGDAEAGGGWPAGDASTLVVLYFPPGVAITDASLGTSCTGFHGFHDNVTLGNGTEVAYAIVPRCASFPEDPSATGINYISAITSHEVIEALTDPFVENSRLNGLGYFETDSDHLAFSMLGLSEVGDMCAVIGGAFYTPPDFPYLVQRIWSNTAATAGQDPCLPAPSGEVYFMSAPLLTDVVNYSMQGFGGTTKGVYVPVGQTKTIPIQLWSDGPTSGPWTVIVKEAGGPHLTLSLDRSSGQNGDTLNLTIQVNSQNPSYGAEPFVVESTLGAETNVWVGLVGN